MNQPIEFWMKQTEIRESALKIAEAKIAKLQTRLDHREGIMRRQMKIIDEQQAQLDAVRDVLKSHKEWKFSAKTTVGTIKKMVNGEDDG